MHASLPFNGLVCISVLFCKKTHMIRRARGRPRAPRPVRARTISARAGGYATVCVHSRACDLVSLRQEAFGGV